MYIPIGMYIIYFFIRITTCYYVSILYERSTYSCNYALQVLMRPEKKIIELDAYVLVPY